jgi:CDP-glucose 4,6-dehydratase
LTSLERHGIAIATARAGNVIGGGDWTRDQLVPDLMRAFLARKPCLIRSPYAIRPWQFVLEPLRGYLMLAERLAADPRRFGSAWNFGPVEVDAKPVSWVADELARLWGGSACWENDNGARPQEAHYLKLDASKAGDLLDWHPVLPLNVAVDWIVEWYRAFQAGDDLRRFTQTQIERYEALARTPTFPSYRHVN